ncbi:MAG: glycoside hydrolase family 25 protein [Oscillospiraceae bacterium]|nr:glycoside hydrolase family 25 protein [Oscillospiraceae bacterium]
MSPVRKKMNDPMLALVQGFAAISVTAAVLGLVLFLSAPRDSRELPAEPTQPVATRPVSRIPENPYGPEDFTYENGLLTCTAGAALPGVDVSAHQGAVDWELVRESGIQFAMIRLGYRGYTNGGIYYDEYARDNLRGAREAGLEIGAYFYSQALTVEEAREEARLCLEVLEGMPLELPVVYDWEYVSQEARTGQMDRQTLTDCARAFCDAIEASGYEAMIYFNPALTESLLDLEALTDYDWWLAMYSGEMTFPHAVEMWQYTASGTIPGIEGDVDVNLLFVEESE